MNRKLLVSDSACSISPPERSFLAGEPLPLVAERRQEVEQLLRLIAEARGETPVDLQDEVGVITTQDPLRAAHGGELPALDVALDDIHPLDLVEQQSSSVSISTSTAPGPALPASAR